MYVLGCFLSQTIPEVTRCPTNALYHISTEEDKTLRIWSYWPWLHWSKLHLGVKRNCSKHTVHIVTVETLKTDLSCLMFTWNSGHPQPHLILFDLGRQVWNEIWPCRDNITELRTAGIDSNRYNRIESPWPGPRTVSSKYNKFRWNRCPFAFDQG